MSINAKPDYSPDSLPLCVDVDEVLLGEALFWETVFTLIRQDVLNLFRLLFWRTRGKDHLGQRILEHVDPAAIFSLHQGFLERLRAEKEGGRTLILVTALPAENAEKIASYLGIFDDVMVIEEESELSEERKRQLLVHVFGARDFDYIGGGDSGKTLADAVMPALSKGHKVVDFLSESKKGTSHDRLKPYLRAARVHQWLKNVLVFVPLVLAHEANQTQLVFQAIAAFLAFGLCASSVYILNDLFDLAADRRHPTKRHRPLASGILPVKRGLVFVPLLLAASFTIASVLPMEFLAWLAVYYSVTLIYSLRLKQAALADALVLAGLYTIRIIAGAAAVAVTASYWLHAFSLFLFYSLALAKRYAELLTVEQQEAESIRGYRTIDLDSIAQSGIASGFLAVLVLALYINSNDVEVLYSFPPLIWLLCPLLLYWINRIWLLTRRNEMHEDPIVFAIEDRRSHWIGLIALLILWVAA